MAGAKVDIPDMKKCPNYSQWKRLIDVWSSVTAIPKSKQADCILLTLDTDAQNLALQVSDEERRKDDGSGVQKILERLDTLYEQNKTQKLFAAFEEFEGFKRSQDMPLAKYISEFEFKANELKSLKVILPEELLAFKLLKNANLTEECARIVRIACNTNAETNKGSGLTFSGMKTTILNAFDCRLDIKASGFSRGSTDVTGTVSVEPFQIKSEPLDTFYGGHSTREEPLNTFYGQGYSAQQDNTQYRSKTMGSWRSSSGSSNGSSSRGKNYYQPYPSYKSGETNRKDNDKMKGSLEQREFRVNRTDNYTGKPSECRICGSIYHWARQCPRNKTQAKQGSALETHTVDITLLSESLNESL